jgi:hypothetical protein
MKSRGRTHGPAREIAAAGSTPRFPWKLQGYDAPRGLLSNRLNFNDSRFMSSSLDLIVNIKPSLHLRSGGAASRRFGFLLVPSARNKKFLFINMLQRPGSPAKMKRVK